MNRNKQTVGYIFTHDMNNVFLVKKNKGPFPNKFNGVGGKGETIDLTPEDIMMRELQEETGIGPEDIYGLTLLDTVEFENSIILYVYYGQMKEGKTITRKINDSGELILQMSVDAIRNYLSPSIFAGNGDVPGHIEAAIQNFAQQQLVQPPKLPNPTIRKAIPIGATVDIVLKKDQKTGELTRGKVGRILTNSSEHHRGIKVMLSDGQVGRVRKIIVG